MKHSVWEHNTLMLCKGKHDSSRSAIRSIRRVRADELGAGYKIYMKKQNEKVIAKKLMGFQPHPG